MSLYLDDPHLAARLLEADPVDVHAVRETAASPAATGLRDAIAASTAVTPIRSRRRRLLMAGAAVAAAAAVAIPLTVTLTHPSSESAYAAPLVRFAENSPRLLVEADGWRVTRADEEDEQTGEMTFSAGPSALDVFWVPGAGGKDSDKHDLTHVGYATIDGERAWVGTYGGREFEAIWSVGDQAREARGAFADRAAFLTVAQTLHRVDVDTWLDAMPSSVVDPSAHAATVEKMLADIPQPNDFDKGALLQTAQVRDRYQLGAQVSGAVACAWVRQWTDGDTAQRNQADAAMATSRHWAILREMSRQGAYSEVVWMVADYMNGVPGTDIARSGESLQDWTRPALGC